MANNMVLTYLQFRILEFPLIYSLGFSIFQTSSILSRVAVGGHMLPMMLKLIQRPGEERPAAGGHRGHPDPVVEFVLWMYIPRSA